MSRKTKSAPLPVRRSTPVSNLSVADWPRLERRLSLVCEPCGSKGEYDVGTVTIDPVVVRSRKGSIDEAVGFIGYFRCRKCDAGGPWELPISTLAYISAMAIAAQAGAEDVPLICGALATFDRQTFRYATDAEAHLKSLIEREPERAFLWVRLGNLYYHGGAPNLACTAFERAIKIDPKDIEAHNMLGVLLVEADRLLDAVPHWHAVLNHVRDARNVATELRKNLVREAIQYLLDAHAASQGQFDLLPPAKPDEFPERKDGEPIVVELREFDLGSESGLDELCDVFLGRAPRSRLNPFRRRSRMSPDASSDWPKVSDRRIEPAVGRNAPCPCGSGQKFKKCCGH